MWSVFTYERLKNIQFSKYSSSFSVLQNSYHDLNHEAEALKRLEDSGAILYLHPHLWYTHTSRRFNPKSDWKPNHIWIWIWSPSPNPHRAFCSGIQDIFASALSSEECLSPLHLIFYQTEKLLLKQFSSDLSNRKHFGNSTLYNV